MHAQTDTDAAREFADIVGESQMLIGERIGPDYHHDEALVGEPVAHALWRCAVWTRFEEAARCSITWAGCGEPTGR
jgi:hypothetical protein